MNWLSKLLGSPDGSLMATGELARGTIVSVRPTGMTMQVMNGLVERTCELGVRVYRDGHPPYDAVATQRVQEVYIPQLSSGQAWVAVRVDAANPSRIAVDFSAPAPEVQVAASEGADSAARILANGRPVDVVVVGAQKLGMTGPTGDDIYALTLTVVDGATPPYEVRVGNAVPAAALPLMFPGSRLPARCGTEPTDIVVDVVAAMARAESEREAGGAPG